MNDRIIVNVDNSIVNAGSSALEVLERSPGVTIDPDDNIALRGRQGVIIMIDGKPYQWELHSGVRPGPYPKANTGISINYRNKKMNAFGSYHYAYRKMLNHLFLDRNFYENGIFTGSDLKDNFTRMPFSSNTASMGTDFFPSKKTIIGFCSEYQSIKCASAFGGFTRW